MEEPINIQEFETAARSVLEPMVFDYYAGGSEDEHTLRENALAWSNYRLVPRAFRDVRAVDSGTKVLGQELAFPVLTAPCAFNKLAHPDGEIAVARAAEQAGIVQILSTASTTSLEDVAEAVPGGNRWFQLYCYKDREITRSLVHRAEAAGYQALCLTVDVAVAGTRERDVRNQFHLPGDIRWANLDHLMGTAPDGSALTAYISDQWERNLSWDTIAWLQSETNLPILVKGIMAPEDAAEAMEHGIAGVVVSNHGGRQLDGAASTCEVLADVATAVDGRGVVVVDGGIRRGTHILKALALGADAVLIGRPYLWGLAHSGRAGVEAVLELLRAELVSAMALCGCTRIQECRSVRLLGTS
ncbi:MAG: 4-hydroxymandelate oxidase [Rhodothermales bacterium]|jgi:4-hydroxymandelate oxidase